MKSKKIVPTKHLRWLAPLGLGLILAIIAYRVVPTTLPPPTPMPPVKDAAAGTVTPMAIVFDEIAPLAATEAAEPAELSIPAINMRVHVEPMGWRVQIINDKRTTDWWLPHAAAGWHLNSAKPGMAGNVVFSGHQLLGEAVFAPIALGDTQLGQDILLTDLKSRIFVYRIVAVTDPIEISSDPTVEEQIAAAYLSQAGTPRLTLISGWPDFTSTHRVFVVAELQGMLQEEGGFHREKCQECRKNLLYADRTNFWDRFVQ